MAYTQFQSTTTVYIWPIRVPQQCIYYLSEHHIDSCISYHYIKASYKLMPQDDMGAYTSTMEIPSPFDVHNRSTTKWMPTPLEVWRLP